MTIIRPKNECYVYIGQCLVGNLNIVADAWCDGEANVPECFWDGGDCCESTCDSSYLDYYSYSCGSGGYDCLAEVPAGLTVEFDFSTF